MSKYIDAKKLIAEIEKRQEYLSDHNFHSMVEEYDYAIDIITSFQCENIAIVHGYLDRNYHEEIRFSINGDTFTGDSALLLPEDSVSFKDLGYDGSVEVELLIRKI